MKISFKLKELGIIDDGRYTIDSNGNQLSNRTMNTIMEFITNKYLYNEYESFIICSEDLVLKCHSYKDYLNHLNQREVIFWGNYKQGSLCRKFYFTDWFKNNAIIDKITWDNHEPTQNTLVPPIDLLISKRLQRDYKSLNLISNDIKKEIMIETSKLTVYKFKSYISSALNIEMIDKGQTYFNWKSGRLYTNFCNCSKKIRLNNFAFKKDNLCSLDIPSSFPLWLAIWSIQKGIDITDYDFQSWCNDVYERNKNGKTKIYDTLREQLNKIKDSDNKNNGDEDCIAKPYYSTLEAKEIFMKWVNGKPKNNIINNIFSQYYPSIYKIVDRNKYKMYDELVKLETNWLMNILVRRLYDEIKGIKIITCHDEIYFQENLLDEVKIIWREELDKVYSILPLSNETIIDDNIIEEAPSIFKEKKKKIRWSEQNKDIDWSKI